MEIHVRLASIIVVLLVFGIAGSIAMLRASRDMKTKLFLLFAILQPLAVIPIIVESRYRYVLFPFLAISAAFFLYSFWKDEEARKVLRPVFIWTFAVLIVFTLYDGAHHIDKILPRLTKFI